MVTRVEKMVVQGPMKPVIEELDRPYVKQRGDDGPISSPDRKEPYIRNCCIGQIELKPIEDDLVIPVKSGKNRLILQLQICMTCD